MSLPESARAPAPPLVPLPIPLPATAPTSDLSNSNNISLALRLTNLSLAACVSILVLNTVFFCVLNDGCPTLPGRSQMGASSKSIVANVELTFLTLLASLLPLSFVLQKMKGAQLSTRRLVISFLIPFLVALCMTFDTKRFPTGHPLIATLILMCLIVLSQDTIVSILVASLIGFKITKWIFYNEASKKIVLARKKAEHDANIQSGNEYKNFQCLLADTPPQFTIQNFFLGDRLGTVFGLLIFIPVVFLMVNNHKYAALP